MKIAPRSVSDDTFLGWRFKWCVFWYAPSTCICHLWESFPSNPSSSCKRHKSTNSSSFWINIYWYSESSDVKLHRYVLELFASVSGYKTYNKVFYKQTALVFRWNYSLKNKLTINKNQIVQFVCKRQIIQTASINKLYSPPYGIVIQWNNNFPILKLRITAPLQAIQ